ncbi:uncharacterized threonine-rich GPI-anchored glycoprotein PJ4664.02, partial [Austrofundulus limnaeus]|uniref:Uncharacterized threonine-rich GPI-anchored glycoprotein PJ4664.02 n=1 Tax=Austrofundulus limnaeus TaxID=52670 RepID=A0A2I4ALY7_AUSLI
MDTNKAIERPRQLPAHLQDYQVSLPQSLMPYAATHQDDNLGASAQQLQSLSLQTKSAIQDGQLLSALGLSQCHSPAAAVDKVSQCNTVLQANTQPGSPVVCERTLSPALSECSLQSYPITDDCPSEPSSLASHQAIPVKLSLRQDSTTWSLPVTLTSTSQFGADPKQPLSTTMSMLQPTTSTLYQPTYQIMHPVTTAVNVQHSGPVTPMPIQYQPSSTDPAYTAYQPHPAASTPVHQPLAPATQLHVLQPTSLSNNVMLQCQNLYTPMTVPQPVYQPTQGNTTQPLYQPMQVNSAQPLYQPMQVNSAQPVYQHTQVTTAPPVYQPPSTITT